MRIKTIIIAGLLMAPIMATVFALTETGLPEACQDSDGDCSFININSSDDSFEAIDLLTSPFGWLNVTNLSLAIPTSNIIKNATLLVEWHTDTGLGADNVNIDYHNGTAWVNCAGPFAESENEINTTCDLTNLTPDQLNNLIVRFRAEDTEFPNAFAYIDYVGVVVNHTPFTRSPVLCEDSDGDCLFGNINTSNNIYESVDALTYPFGYLKVTDWDKDVPFNSQLNSAFVYVEWSTDEGLGILDINIDYWDGDEWINCSGPFTENATDQLDSCNLSSLSILQLNNLIMRFRANDTEFPPAFFYIDHVYMEVDYKEITGIGFLEVELIAPNPGFTTNVIQNTTFIINATIYCRDGLCGNVNATARYNLTSADPDTPINVTEGGKPFYIAETPANSTKNCPAELGKDESCNISWIVNTTGDISSLWNIDVIFESGSDGVQDNDTYDATISILSCTVDFDLQWSSIGFGSLDPSTTQNPAPGNAESLYNITINTGSCNLDLYIRGTDLVNSTMGTVIGAGNITWSNTTNSYESSFNLSSENTIIKADLAKNNNLTTWYWINVPPIYAGYYNATIYITGVKNGETP